jgi:thioredoxin 1
MSESIVKELKKNDLGLLDNGVHLVTFWAPWCGHCTNFKPVLEELASEMNSNKVSFFKLNIDDEKEFATTHGVNAVPTLKIFKNGKVIETMTGARKKDDLKKQIENHC